MTTAMSRAIKEEPNSRKYPALLARLKAILAEGNYSQTPQLTSSQRFDVCSTRHPTYYLQPMLHTRCPRVHLDMSGEPEEL